MFAYLISASFAFSFSARKDLISASLALKCLLMATLSAFRFLMLPSAASNRPLTDTLSVSKLPTLASVACNFSTVAYFSSASLAVNFSASRFLMLPSAASNRPLTDTLSVSKLPTLASVACNFSTVAYFSSASLAVNFSASSFLMLASLASSRPVIFALFVFNSPISASLADMRPLITTLSATNSLIRARSASKSLMVALSATTRCTSKTCSLTSLTSPVRADGEERLPLMVAV